MPEPNTPTRPPGASTRATFVLLAVLATLAGCDIPTDLPRIETRWIVPAEETRFGVAQLLPAMVSVSSDSSAFLVEFDPASFSRTLGEVCGLACTAADGLTVPKPPFLGVVESQIDFPPEVFAISVVDGEVTLEITNRFGFDPIRPAAGAFGSMTLRVTDDADGDVLSELVVSGADTTFADGTTQTRTLTLAPIDVNGSLVASVVLDSPAGDPVTIDASAELSVVATPGLIRVASVAVDVSNEPVAFDPRDLNVGDIDQDLEDRLIQGSFLLNVTNPFGVAADFDLSITGGTLPIMRTASITSAASSQVRIDFTGNELRSFLGEDGVVLSGSAVIDAGAGVVTVLPGQELILEAQMDLTVEIGGGQD